MTARVPAPKFFGHRMRRSAALVGWEYVSKSARFEAEIAEAAWGRTKYLGSVHWHGQRVERIARGDAPQEVADQLEAAVQKRLCELRTITRMAKGKP